MQKWWHHKSIFTNDFIAQMFYSKVYTFFGSSDRHVCDLLNHGAADHYVKSFSALHHSQKTNNNVEE
jgi:hypothetical protein